MITVVEFNKKANQRFTTNKSYWKKTIVLYLLFWLCRRVIYWNGRCVMRETDRQESTRGPEPDVRIQKLESTYPLY